MANSAMGQGSRTGRIIKEAKAYSYLDRGLEPERTDLTRGNE
jgi:hypothetical protein